MEEEKKMKFNMVGFAVAVGVVLLPGMAAAQSAHIDIQARVLQVEKDRVAALLAQDWEAVRRLAGPGFNHQESNKQVRNIDQFVAAMRWCGKDGVTPGLAAEMPRGGGFSFAEHNIDWSTVVVWVAPDGRSAIASGKYTNNLRRCFTRPDGTTGVETPEQAKPAAFVRFYVDGLIIYHRAMVDSGAPAGSMSVQFPPPKP